MRAKLNLLLFYCSSPNYPRWEKNGKEYSLFNNREASKQYYGKKRTSSTLNVHFGLFAAWGLIEKYVPSPDDEEMNGTEEAILESARTKSFYPEMSYHIPEWTDEVLSIAEERCKIWVEGKHSMKGVGYELICDVYGQEVADRAYPTHAGKGVRDSERMLSANIFKFIEEQIKEHGYTTKNIILKRLPAANRTYTKLSGRIKSKYRVGRPTNEEKKRWNIKNNQWIIRPRLD